jgi:hypothetical protein
LSTAETAAIPGGIVGQPTRLLLHRDNEENGNEKSVHVELVCCHAEEKTTCGLFSATLRRTDGSALAAEVFA